MRSEIARRAIGLDAKLVGEDRDARPIDTQRTGSILVRRVEAHQPADDTLVEGIEAQALIGAFDRRPEVALLLKQPDQPVEDAQMLVRQPLALGQDPLVVDGREEHAAVAVDGVLEGLSRGSGLRLVVGGGRGRHGPLVIVDVDRQVGSAFEREDPAPTRHEPLGSHPRPPQLVEELTKVVVGLRLRGVGPEQERDLPTRLGDAAVEGEVRDEGLGPR